MYSADEDDTPDGNGKVVSTTDTASSESVVLSSPQKRKVSIPAIFQQVAGTGLSGYHRVDTLSCMRIRRA